VIHSLTSRQEIELEAQEQAEAEAEAEASKTTSIIARQSLRVVMPDVQWAVDSIRQRR